MKIKFITLLLISILTISFSYSQTGSVRGFVYDKETGEPVIFTNIIIKNTKYGGATDVNGFFNITRIDPGTYTLQVSFIGYEQLQQKITITKNKILNLKLNLEKQSVKLKEAVISGERQELKTQIHTSIVKITPKQINKLPSIGAEPDLAQYLQVVPGVIFTGDQGGQLYIRGGSPIQNKVLLDNMVVYNPFHSIGLFSVFDNDIIRNADIYTGGFNAEYGGRISSIMDITMRDGNKKDFHGKFSVNTFGSKLMIEGPLKKETENSKTTISYILSGKTSYLEQSSKLLYTYIDTGGLPFNFDDFYGKVSINGKNGSKVNVFGYNFADNVHYQAVHDLHWNSYGIGSNVIVVPSSSSVLIKANMSYSNYEITLQEEDQLPRYSMINGFNFGLTFVYFLGKDEFDYGIETLGHKTDFQFYNSIGRSMSYQQYTTELNGFLKYKMTLNKLLIEPGLRLQYYASLGELSPEPRIGIKYNVNDKFRVKFSGGFYSQNLIAANSDRDVVNLFYGFLSGPENLQVEYKGEELKTKLQKSRHAILGFEYDLTSRLNLNIEGYYKQNIQLTNINRNKIYDDTPDNYMIADVLKKDFIIETGDAYGVDFLLKYDYRRIYFWFVYSLGYVTRDDGISNYIPHFDRRHNVNIVSSYVLGKDLNWELSVRWNLGSGFPFTQTQGYYELLPFTNGISTNYVSTNGNLGVYYGGLNKGRLPYYHRLDATVKRHIEFVKSNAKMEIALGITNIYNRKNIFYIDRIKNKKVYQLPIMPSLGLNIKF